LVALCYFGEDGIPPPATNPTSFYSVSKTCQIPRLSMLYERYFGCCTNGCFVEIGAYDGESFSNTSGLADAGWRGYYVEPVPDFADKCRIRHSTNKNVKVDQLAIANARKSVTMHVAGPLSTADGNMKSLFCSLEWARSYFSREVEISVEAIPLDEYLRENAIPEGFELLSVDVEGFEWEVLRNFPMGRWKPRMVIIELHDHNDDYLGIRQQCNSLVEYFEDNAYRVIYKDFTNTVYVRKDTAAVPRGESNAKPGQIRRRLPERFRQ